MPNHWSQSSLPSPRHDPNGGEGNIIVLPDGSEPQGRFAQCRHEKCCSITNSTVLPSGASDMFTEFLRIVQTSTNAIVCHFQSPGGTISFAAYASKSNLDSVASPGAVPPVNNIDLSPRLLFLRPRPLAAHNYAFLLGRHEIHPKSDAPHVAIRGISQVV